MKNKIKTLNIVVLAQRRRTCKILQPTFKLLPSYLHPHISSFGILFCTPQNRKLLNLVFPWTQFFLIILFLNFLLFGHPPSSAVWPTDSPAHFDLCFASTSSRFSPVLNIIIPSKKKGNAFNWCPLMFCFIKLSVLFSGQFSSEIFR